MTRKRKENAPVDQSGKVLGEIEHGKAPGVPQGEIDLLHDLNEMVTALGEAERCMDALIERQKAAAAEMLEIEKQLTQLGGQLTDEIARIITKGKEGEEGDDQAQLWAETLATQLATQTKDLTDAQRDVISKIAEGIETIQTLATPPLS